MRKRRRPKQDNKRGYEKLEPKNLLAGDVMVFTHNSMLFIRGDGADNQIEVVGQDDGRVEVRGNDSTTINGSSDSYFFEPGENGLTGIRANTGRGHDSLFVENVEVQGRAVVYGGQGNDSVGFYQVSVSRDLMVQASRGDDYVSIDEVSVGRNLIVNTKSGDDVIGVDNSTIDGLTLIWSGSGHDDVGLRNSTHDYSAWIFTGGGNDFVGADNLTVNLQTVLVSGSGSDDVYVNDSNFNGRTFAIGGGSRFDNLEVDGTTSFEQDPFVRGFEGDDVAGGKLQLSAVFNDLITAGARLGTIAELAALTPQLSTLAGALEATGLDAALQGDGPFTVFAPLNSAFEKIADTVAGLTTEQLTDVLLFHVAADELFAADVVELTEIDTLLGQPFAVEIVNGGVVLNGNATLAATDIRAKNGVVHLLNDVLVPGVPA